MKIRTTFLVAAAVIIVVSGAFLAILTTTSATQALRSSLDSNTELLARVTLNDIELLLKERVDTMSVYARDLAREEALAESNLRFAQMENRDAYIQQQDALWRSGNDPSLVNTLTDPALSSEIIEEFQAPEFYTRRYGYPLYLEAFVTNAYGVNVAQTGTTTDYYQADEEWWQEAKNNEVAIEDFEFDESVGVEAIDLAFRVESPSGEFLGVFKVVLDARVIGDVLHTADQAHAELFENVAQEHSDLTLLSATGKIVYSTSELGLTEYPSEIRDRILYEERGSHFFSFRAVWPPTGHMRLFSHAHVVDNSDFSPLHWTLVISHRESEILAPIGDLRITIILIILASLVFAAFSSWWVARSISRPLEHLTASVRRVEDGDLDHRIEASGFSEVGTLARSFNRMISSLRRSREEIEERVEEQTAEIREKNTRLAEAKARDDAILQSIGEGILVMDKDGKVMFVNKAGASMLGIAPDEAVGGWANNVMRKETEAGDKLPYSETTLSQVLEGESVEINSTEQLYLLRDNGTRFPIASTITPVVLGGRTIGAVEVFKDATAEVEVNRAKTEFVSLASHQLRTPLSSINWYTEMLLAGDAGTVNDEQKQFLKEIYAGNQRMVTLVNSLLNVSRIESGTLTIKNETVDMAALTNTVLKEFKEEIQEKKLEVTPVKETGEQYEVSTDPNIAHIVIHNLISNAVKYTPTGGSVHISMQRKEGGVIISVADSGYGIPEHQQDKLFTKLFRADNVKQKVTDGTGLGLYMVQKIMDKIGGSIWFESEEGNGSTFSVSWPLSGTREQKGTKDIIADNYTPNKREE